VGAAKEESSLKAKLIRQSKKTFALTFDQGDGVVEGITGFEAASPGLRAQSEVVNDASIRH
jgi:hypothetical protein